MSAEDKHGTLSGGSDTLSGHSDTLKGTGDLIEDRPTGDLFPGLNVFPSATLFPGSLVGGGEG